MDKKINILVAGANGFIGRNVISSLYQFGDIYRLGKTITIEDKVFQIDLINREHVDNLFSKDIYYDVLIFLVGLAHSKGSMGTKELHMDTNYGSLVNCLESMRKYKMVPKKIIFSSTISVYGENLEKMIYDEKCSLNPSSPYAVSKKKAEVYLINNFSENVWILRYAPVYGNNFTRNIDRRTIIKKKYYKVGFGKRKLSLCNIDNIKHIFSEILSNNIPNGIFNVSDQNIYTYNDLLHYQNAKSVLKLPRFAFFILYYIGRIFNINYLIENSIKLISDNIYPSKKIQGYTKLKATLK